MKILPRFHASDTNRKNCASLLALLCATILIAGCLGGCATNLVSFNQWSSTVTLIDPDGGLSEGTAVFHWAYRDGNLEIPKTRYGSLSGKFATQTPSLTGSRAGVAAIVGDSSFVVPTLSSMNIQSGSSQGTAFLAHDGKVVLQCNIGVDFKTMGMGDAQMIGNGICADREGKLWRIQFGR